MAQADVAFQRRTVAAERNSANVPGVREVPDDSALVVPPAVTTWDCSFPHHRTVVRLSAFYILRLLIARRFLRAPKRFLAPRTRLLVLSNPTSHLECRLRLIIKALSLGISTVYLGALLHLVTTQLEEVENLWMTLLFTASGVRGAWTDYTTFAGAVASLRTSHRRFRPATAVELEEYDDVCAICLS